MNLPHRVLFVEDYPPFKRSFARLLTREFGLAVTVAESGEEAIGQFGAVSPELVILDLGLPGVDGTDTLQVLRALPGGDKVPVVVLTGSNDPEKKSAAEQLNIDGYVLKENVTAEFSGVLLSIFPDLAASEHGHTRAPTGSVSLDMAFDAGATNIGGSNRVPHAKRSVRVLLPTHTVAPAKDTAHWARRLARRALVAVPRMFGDPS